jgi:tryptophan-rich sensory protein
VTALAGLSLEFPMGSLTHLTAAMKAALFVLAGIALAIAGNGLVFYFGLGSTGARKLLTPAGWEWVDKIVAFVWVGLFAMLAMGAWCAFNSSRPTGKTDALLIWGLLIICLLYPVYTLGFQVVPGLIGNIVVLLLSCGLCIFVRRSSLIAAASIVPVIVWLSVATIYVVKLIKANP